MSCNHCCLLHSSLLTIRCCLCHSAQSRPIFAQLPRALLWAANAWEELCAQRRKQVRLYTGKWWRDCSDNHSTSLLWLIHLKTVKLKKQIRVVVNQLARAINTPPKARDYLIVQYSWQILLSATAVAAAAVLATAVKWQGQIVAVAAMVITWFTRGCCFMRMQRSELATDSIMSAYFCNVPHGSLFASQIELFAAPIIGAANVSICRILWLFCKIICVSG